LMVMNHHDSKFRSPSYHRQGVRWNCQLESETSRFRDEIIIRSRRVHDRIAPSAGSWCNVPGAPGKPPPSWAAPFVGLKDGSARKRPRWPSPTKYSCSSTISSLRGPVMRRPGTSSGIRNRRHASGNGLSKPWNAWAIQSRSSVLRNCQAGVSSLLRLSQDCPAFRSKGKASGGVVCLLGVGYFVGIRWNVMI
jgi:hypothetical protein